MEDFFLSVLNATATKREAKSYLSRFTPSKMAAGQSRKRTDQFQSPPAGEDYDDRERLRHPSPNLAGLYTSTKAVEDVPVFSQDPGLASEIREAEETLHVALVKIRNPQSLDQETLEGLGQTLSKLSLLGLRSCVIVDCGQGNESSEVPKKAAKFRELVIEQADRIVAGINSSKGSGSRRLDHIIGVSEKGNPIPKSAPLIQVTVSSRAHLLAPLRRGIIPVVASIGYTTDSQAATSVCPDDVFLALAKELAGLLTASHDESPVDVAERIKSHQTEVSLDKIILLDPLGGIPAADRPHGSHVFINMEQEFDDIIADLINGITEDQPHHSPGQQPLDVSGHYVHVRNLELLRRTLALLPPSSSGLLISPGEAAHPGGTNDESPSACAVGTRRQKNPLIHNLLTDKPAFSSSLPFGRQGKSSSAKTPSENVEFTATPTTFVKRGMPLTMLPDPMQTGWIAPAPGQATIRLDDPRIDLPRLIHLIEDSFGRKLDVEHYLARVNDRVAGIIIAGEYDGAALLTWEDPPQTMGDSNPGEFQHRKVPYLDKFAVLKRSQGAGGVADILFKAMVRTCFPDGVCWRSRRNNPVNKWYFERARGTWKMQDSSWTMFWTTHRLESHPQLFRDFEGVCRTVQSSWADSKTNLPKTTAFIGLGSNLGDRLGMIETACGEMDKRGLKVQRTSSLWETEAMYVVDQSLFINGVCEVTTDLAPTELLDQLQEVEKSMGRQKIVDKGPRNIDLDVLLHGEQKVDLPRLKIPHPLMLEREFVLRPLCQLAPNAVLSNSDPPKTIAAHLEDLPRSSSHMSTLTSLTPSISPLEPLSAKRATQVMAILNLTPDSFSDGGHHSCSDVHLLAAQTMEKLKLAGSTLLDIGGQSSRPGAKEVGEEEELSRILPAIRAVRRTLYGSSICISVDTYRARVAAEAVAAGADLINDVSAGTMDRAMLSTVAKLGKTVCLMHMRGTPTTMKTMTDYPDGVVSTVGRELLMRVRAAEAAGIRRWRIILDPGIGFAKTEAQNLELLRRLPELRNIEELRGFPWLVGASRKGFIGRITGVEEARERTWGTAAAVSAAIAGGADIVRVHDVHEMSRVAKMADAIWRH